MPTATEQQFADKMTADGWSVYHNGFPDFLCVKDGKVIVVEVKGSSSEQLKEHQQQILANLNNNTIEAFVWAPNMVTLTPFEEYPTSSVSKNRGLPIFQPEELFGNSNLPLSLAHIVITTLHNKDGKSIQAIADMFGVSYETIRREILKAKAL